MKEETLEKLANPDELILSRRGFGGLALAIIGVGASTGCKKNKPLILDQYLTEYSGTLRRDDVFRGEGTGIEVKVNMGEYKSGNFGVLVQLEDDTWKEYALNNLGDGTWRIDVDAGTNNDWKDGVQVVKVMQYGNGVAVKDGANVTNIPVSVYANQNDVQTKLITMLEAWKLGGAGRDYSFGAGTLHVPTGDWLTFDARWSDPSTATIHYFADFQWDRSRIFDPVQSAKVNQDLNPLQHGFVVKGSINEIDTRVQAVLANNLSNPVQDVQYAPNGGAPLMKGAVILGGARILGDCVKSEVDSLYKAVTE